MWLLLCPLEMFL
uniref:Uncharacterized protein n=1 Tax=Arundo donax TaxID=35708 RepID=A0A0A9B785_ARUDO